MYDDSSSIVRLKTMGKILDDFEGMVSLFVRKVANFLVDNYLSSQQVQAVPASKC